MRPNRTNNKVWQDPDSFPQLLQTWESAIRTLMTWEWEGITTSYFSGHCNPYCTTDLSPVTAFLTALSAWTSTVHLCWAILTLGEFLQKKLKTRRIFACSSFIFSRYDLGQAAFRKTVLYTVITEGLGSTAIIILDISSTSIHWWRTYHSLLERWEHCRASILSAFLKATTST